MSDKKIFFAVLAIIIFLFPTCKDKSAKFKDVNLKGQFKYVGNMPFAQLAFQSNRGELYFIIERDTDTFKRYLGKTLKIKAKSASLVMETAGKRYRKKKYYLKHIKILKE
ncbi:hypothetical protein ACFL20_01910 [Spirochaetota bacterium]